MDLYEIKQITLRSNSEQSTMNVSNVIKCGRSMEAIHINTHYFTKRALIPGMLKNWQEGDLEQIQSLLRVYQDKYAIGGFDFLGRLFDQSPLEF